MTVDLHFGLVLFGKWSWGVNEVVGVGNLLFGWLRQRKLVFQIVSILSLYNKLVRQTVIQLLVLIHAIRLFIYLFIICLASLFFFSLHTIRNLFLFFQIAISFMLQINIIIRKKISEEGIYNKLYKEISNRGYQIILFLKNKTWTQFSDSDFVNLLGRYPYRFKALICFPVKQNSPPCKICTNYFW